MAVAGAAAATAIGAITKQAVDGYANYEQLVGGVETLFGAQGMSLSEYAASMGKSIDEVSQQWHALEQAQDIVMDNANDAFRTAGLSANDYMEQVTSFSASLIQSLDGDTVAAAKAADRAIIDMSDNANKMGTAMESIQNAYNGFAKGQYQLLDNLKLGYDGTKTEMERLIADAAKMTDVQKELGLTVDENSMSFGNIVNAISVIQSSMGIAGTTSKEAASTISGSLGTVKAAWQNLIVGMADDSQDFDALIDNFVNSVTAFGTNIIPRIQTALGGVGRLITELAPIIIDALPGLFEQVVEPLLESAVSLLGTLGQALINNAPMLVETGINLIMQLIQGLIDGLPNAIGKITNMIQMLGQLIIDNAPLIIQGGIELIAQLAIGLAEALPTLIPTIIDVILVIVDTIIDNIDLLIDGAIAIILGLADGLIAAQDKLLVKIPELVGKIVTALIKNAPKLALAAVELLLALGKGMIQYIQRLLEYIPRVATQVLNGFNKTDWSSIGHNIIEGVKNGIMKRISGLVDTVKGAASSVLNAWKGVFDIHSPSKKFAWMADMCIAGFDNEFKDYDPYETLDDSFKTNAKSLQASFVGSVGNMAGVDLSAIGGYVRSAIEGMAVVMDSKPVGALVANSVNAELGRIAMRGAYV